MPDVFEFIRIPAPSKDPLEVQRLNAFLDGLKQEGQTAQGRWNKQWPSNLRQLRGDQWPDKHDRPMFLADIISPMVRRKASLLTELKPKFQVRPGKDGLRHTAEILTDAINAGWDEMAVEMALEQLSLFMRTFGSGFWAVEWDPHASFGLGSIVIRTIDPRHILLDPAVKHSHELHKARYIVEWQVLTLAEIQERFPKTGMEVRPSLVLSGEQQPQTVQDNLLKDMGAVGRPDAATIPRAILETFSIIDPARREENGESVPIFSGGRVIHRAGGVILNPEEREQRNPFFDGLFPYQMIDNAPDAEHPWGKSEVESLRRIQEAINRIGNTFVVNLIKNVDWIITDNNALDADTITTLKRLRAVIIAKQGGREFTRQPASLPGSDALSFVQLALTLAEFISGVSDIDIIGKGRLEVRSSDLLQDLQGAAQVLVRAEARRLESFLERAGQMWISRIFQFWTSDRIFAFADGPQIREYAFERQRLNQEITRTALQRTAERMFKTDAARAAVGKPALSAEEREDVSAHDVHQAVRSAWRDFRFRIVPLSTLSSSREQRARLLGELAAAGAIPLSAIVKEAGFENPDELMEQAAVEIQARLAKGIPPPPPPKRRS